MFCEYGKSPEDGRPLRRSGPRDCCIVDTKPKEVLPIENGYVQTSDWKEQVVKIILALLLYEQSKSTVRYDFEAYQFTYCTFLYLQYSFGLIW